MISEKYNKKNAYGGFSILTRDPTASGSTALTFNLQFSV